MPIFETDFAAPPGCCPIRGVSPLYIIEHCTTSSSLTDFEVQSMEMEIINSWTILLESFTSQKGKLSKFIQFSQKFGYFEIEQNNLRISIYIVQRI